MKWIPVKEKLPEREDFFIVTVYDRSIDKKNIICDVRFDPATKEWFDICYDEDSNDTEEYNIEECDGEVIAWMERPKPYDGD